MTGERCLIIGAPLREEYPTVLIDPIERCRAACPPPRGGCPVCAHPGANGMIIRSVGRLRSRRGCAMTTEPTSFDLLFRSAVSAVDAGDVPALERLMAEHPELASERLEAPGQWLRDQVGDALDGFFARPYLLWFVVGRSETARPAARQHSRCRPGNRRRGAAAAGREPPGSTRLDAEARVLVGRRRRRRGADPAARRADRRRRRASREREQRAGERSRGCREAPRGARRRAHARVGAVPGTVGRGARGSRLQPAPRRSSSRSCSRRSTARPTPSPG